MEMAVNDNSENEELFHAGHKSTLSGTPWPVLGKTIFDAATK